MSEVVHDLLTALVAIGVPCLLIGYLAGILTLLAHTPRHPTGRHQKSPPTQIHTFTAPTRDTHRSP